MANCGNATPEAKRGFQSDAVCRAFKQAIIAQNNLCPKQKVEDLCKPKVSCVSTPAKEHPKCWSSGPKGVILSKCRFRKGFISPIPKILDPKANSILREVSPNKKISSNRMHSLESVNDLRSWGLNVDERRRYFLEQMSPRANENEQEEQHDDGFLQIVEANSDDVINGKTVVNTDFIGPSSSQQSVVPGSAPPPEIAHGSSEAAETASSHGSTYRVPSQHPSANESHRNTSKSSISQNGFSPGNAENTSGSLQKKEDSLASVTIPRVNEPLNHQQNRSPDLAPTESSREVSSLQEGERGSISGPKDKRGSSSSLPEERRDSGTSQSNEKKSSISSGLGERKSSSSGPHEERKTSGSSQPGVKSDSTASISDERKALDSSQREEKMVSGSSLPENARNEPCALTNDNLPGPQGTNWNELANQQASRLNEVDGQVLIETCKTQIDQLKMALCNERKLNEEYKRQIYNLQQQLTNGQGGVGLPGMPASQEKCYEDQIGYLREQLARMEEVNKNLEQEYACEKATFDQFYNQVAGLEAEYNRLASAAGEMEKDLENRARSEQSVQKQLIDFNALVSSQKNEIARLAAENQVLKNDIDQIQAQMGDHMNSAASNTKQNDQSKPGVQQQITSTPKSGAAADGAAAGGGNNFSAVPETGHFPSNQPPTSPGAPNQPCSSSATSTISPGNDSAAKFNEPQLDSGTHQQQRSNGYFQNLPLSGGDQVDWTSPCGTGVSPDSGYSSAATGFIGYQRSATPIGVAVPPRGFTMAPPLYYNNMTQENFNNGVYQQNIGIQNQPSEQQRSNAYFFSLGLPGEGLNNQMTGAILGGVGRSGGFGISPGQEILRGQPANNVLSLSPDGVAPQYNGYQLNSENPNQSAEQHRSGGYFFSAALPGQNINNQEILRGPLASEAFRSPVGLVIQPYNEAVPQYSGFRQNCRNQGWEQQRSDGYFFSVALPGDDQNNQMPGTARPESLRGFPANQQFVSPNGMVISPANGSVPQYIGSQQNIANQSREQQRLAAYFLGVTLPGGDPNNQSSGGGCR